MIVAIATIVVAIADADSTWNFANAASVPLGGSARLAVMGTSAGYDMGSTRLYRRDFEASSTAATPGSFRRSSGVVEIHNTKQKKRPSNRIDRTIQTLKMPAAGVCPHPKGAAIKASESQKPHAGRSAESLCPTKNFLEKKFSQFKYFLSSSPILSKILP